MGRIFHPPSMGTLFIITVVKAKRQSMTDVKEQFVGLKNVPLRYNIIKIGEN